MSDKDDLFTPEEEFGDLETDDFFSDEVETPVETEDNEEKPDKKVKVPSSIPETEATVEEPEPVVEEPKEPEVEKSEPETAPKKTTPKKAAPKTKGLSKRASKPLTIQEKEVNKILRVANIEASELIDIAELTKDERKTAKVKISDIAVFIKKPENEMFAKLFEKMSNLNTVNLSAEVDPKRVKDVAASIVSAGRMYQPIQVAEIEEDGTMQCTSGRHRLVGLAILYGPDSEVVVQVEKMDLATARDAVVVANMARKAKAMEQAEHAALSSVKGNVDAGQDELYANMVKNKTTSKKYCTYTVLDRGRPVKLGFKVGDRKTGAVTTHSGVEAYWGSAINWYKEMARKDFDVELKASTEFLNKLIETFEGNSSFEAKQHAATMTLSAIGKYYKTMKDAGVTADADQLGAVVVAMGEIGRQKSEATYEAIVKAMK